MQDNEFIELLNEKIEALSNQKKLAQQNLLNAEWHRIQVQESINNALDQLEELAQREEVDGEKELLSLLNQVPALVHSIWANEVRRSDILEQEISRWKEMSRYYERFLANKKEEEERKKNEEKSRNDVEKADDKLATAIAAGEASEPTKMDAIRRQFGQRPAPAIGRFRKLASKVNNEEETDADDSRG